MPAHILLLRHGQSTWNADGRWQGTEDPPLSNLGTRQAKAAAQTLGAFDALVASNLERARHTAEIIAAEAGIGPVQVDPDLRERHAGEWQGLTKPEIEQRWPGWIAGGRVPEGWEPDESIVDRVTGALARVAGMVGDGGTALVISHGGVLSTLLRMLDVEVPKHANLAGRWFSIGPGEFRALDHVETVDDATVPDQI